MAERARQGLSDALSGLILAIVGVVGLLSLKRNATLTTFDFGTDPGPALVPRLLLLALLVGGIGLIGLGLTRTATAGIGPVAVLRTAALRRHAVLIAFVLSLAIYLGVLPRIGFVSATLMFSTSWIAILTRKAGNPIRPRTVTTAIVGATVITTVIYYVFKGFVKVPLP